MNKALIPVLLTAVTLSAAAYLAVPAAAEEIAAAEISADAADTKTGWQTENGKRYYYNADGKKAVGEVTVEGVAYLFAPNGAQQVGWQTVHKKRFYFDPENGKAVYGWLGWRGETYYISRTNGKLTGTAKTDDGETYMFDEYGVCVKWHEDKDGKWHYGTSTGETVIDGQPYLFSEDGVLETGWQTASDEITRYYDAKTHEILTGWITDAEGRQFYADPEKGQHTGWLTADNGKRFYLDKEKGLLKGWQMIGGKQYKLLDDGSVFTGFYTVTGKTYLFGEDGVMVTGFYEDDKGTRYFAANGVMATGTQVIDGKTYYFDVNGLMQTMTLQDAKRADGTTGKVLVGADGKRVTGWATVGDQKYYFDADGFMAVTPTVIDGKTYLFDKDGKPVSGLYTAANGSKYYGDASGIAQTGFIKDAQGTRYFGANGVMVTGLQTIDGKSYFFDANGLMQTSGFQDVKRADGTTGRILLGADGKRVTGWATVGDKKYYFDADGFMAVAPTVIDGKTYLFDKDGQPVSGLYTAANGSKYFGDANGIAQTGWQELPNQSSYFNANGTMAVSTTIDGYTIDANGAAKGTRAAKADAYIQQSVKSVNGIYQTFANNFYYSDIEAARTTDQLMQAGWDKLIDPTLTKKRGVCYHLAATLDFTFKRAGIQSRIVYAWHNSHHYWVQVNIDGTWWNYDPTYGMNRCHITIEQQNAADIAHGGPGYTLRGYVDAVYDHKGALVSATYTPIG